MKKAVYPGSFDPVTNGHLNLIRRASKFIDELTVLIGINPKKNTLFSSAERVEMIEENIKDLPHVKVDTFHGLIVDYLEDNNINLIIRGLRAMSDFEDEFQMALMNKKLSKEVETIMLITKGEYNYLSSSAVKEVAQFNGCIDELVPENVVKKVQEKYSKK